MTWHTVTVPVESLAAAVLAIGNQGGVVTASCPGGADCVLTYVTYG